MKCAKHTFGRGQPEKSAANPKIKLCILGLAEYMNYRSDVGLAVRIEIAKFDQNLQHRKS